MFALTSDLDGQKGAYIVAGSRGDAGIARFRAPEDPSNMGKGMMLELYCRGWH